MVCRLLLFMALLLVSTLVFQDAKAHLKIGRELNLAKLKDFKRQKEMTNRIEAGPANIEVPERNGEKEVPDCIRSLFENKNRRF